LTPWESVDYVEQMVGSYGEIGIDDFVLLAPALA
jgi:hypothetical protein